MYLVGADPRTSFHVLKKDVRTPHHFDARGVRRDGRMLYDLERITGLEPAQTAWKAVVLPLHHIRISLAPIHTPWLPLWGSWHGEAVTERAHSSSPVDTKHLRCTLFAQTQVSATPFCSLCPPLAAVANVPSTPEPFKLHERKNLLSQVAQTFGIEPQHHRAAPSRRSSRCLHIIKPTAKV